MTTHDRPVENPDVLPEWDGTGALTGRVWRLARSGVAADAAVESVARQYVLTAAQVRRIAETDGEVY